MPLHLQADLNARYQRFVARVRAENEVWLLVDPDLRGAWVESNEYVARDGEPVVVHLIFSAAAYAQRHATGPWEDMTPVSMDLATFTSGPLLQMHEAGHLLGPDFNADLAGVEVEPLDLAAALVA
ncbi:hypothetical protein A5645_06130 [Mycobacterium asiaticum]|uniref:DUF2750 domain-containing protein n=1 Tax=Mycobacterium asiaticum TaxID=1790 RepID=UPI0007EF6A95|nr:DUF2750 domain-containing protein [Mycobacterium asiaticum]OBK97517.1 hypothetical protein A5645_06130 [Mycobacterium asiaticum]